MYSYQKLKKNIETLCMKINVPKELYPMVGCDNQASRPYILIEFPYLILSVSEHGKELKKERFLNVDSLLYAVFDNITFEMALIYEKEHRMPNQDFRRILFSHQMKLMKQLSDEWEVKLKTKISKILNEYPYDDADKLQRKHEVNKTNNCSFPTI